MFLLGCQVLCLLSVFLVVKSSDLSDTEKNTVALLFQDVSLSDWNSGNKTALLQKITLDALNVVCANNPSRCALNFWNDSRKFEIKHVVVVEAPKQEGKDVQVKLFVSLPDGSDIRKDSHSVIPGSILQEILQAHKHNITGVVGAEIKSINTKSDSEENSKDNKMNYIMIPISFTVLIVLCFVACCLHCASKRRQKAIDVERRKQTLRKLRGNSSNPSAADSNERHVPTQNTASGNVSAITVIHEEDTRKKRRKKHKTEESYHNNEQQEQIENDESRDLARKRKKKTKQSKHQRLEEHSTLAPAVHGGQWEEGERERVPTPMPVHRGLSTNTDPGKSFEEEPRERKHKRKKKYKKTHSQLREYDEGFDEGSETRQTGNSEDSLLKSLPRPRQLAPLQERSSLSPTIQL
ncbi:uncharacterized protein LOC144666048 isoform X1 [Oculina patagonica]